MSFPRARDFHLPGRSEVIAANGMCATSHPLGAKVAVEVLEAGGNAVDAALAGAVTLGICEPQMTGIGGDLFALIAHPDGRIEGLNASGRAPAALSAEAIRAEGHAVIPPGSAHAVTIPTAVAGIHELATTRGRIGLDRVLAPAIRYADEGVPVAPRVAFDWNGAVGALKGAARTHFSFGGAAPAPGRIFRAPAQAEALRRIAAEGRDGFYKGEVMEDMLGALNALGGVHTAEDFAAAKADWVEPVSGTYRGAELIELPPNGHGAAAILMANIMESFDLAALDPFGARRAHLEAEAAKLAYDARDRLVADPDVAGAEGRLAKLLSKDFAAKLAALIDPERPMAHPAKTAEAVHKETIYITVVDKDRMQVSLIYSIFSNFGSGLASDRFGILFHDRGRGFTLAEGHPNEAAGGKRPLHTIIPGLIREGGEVTRCFGVMGGPYQPNGHVRVLSNLVDYGMEPQAALDAPRSYATEGVLRMERGYAPEVREALAGMGHAVEAPETAIGGAQMITTDREMGVLRGASDPRKDGCALGY